MKPIMKITLGERLALDSDWNRTIKLLHYTGILERVNLSKEDDCLLEVYLGVIPYYSENALLIIEQWLNYIKNIGVNNVPSPKLCDKWQEADSINRTVWSRTRASGRLYG